MLQRPEKGIRYHGTGVKDGYVRASMGVLGIEQGPLFYIQGRHFIPLLILLAHCLLLIFLK